MKIRYWMLSLMAVTVCLTWLVNPRSASAADENNLGPAERLERLERRINELGERQEQMWRRLDAQQNPPQQMLRRLGAAPGRQGWIPEPGAAGLRPAAPGMGPVGPLPARAARGCRDLLGLIFLVCVLCNILLAIWIFTDIRKRGEGHGIFIALALVAGIPAAIIYSLVRIGDKVAATPK